MLNFALEHNIGVECCGNFSSNTPCASNPEERRIVINTNFHDSKQLPLQAAHEVGHILNHHSGVLYFTPSKAQQEAEANRTAISILVPMFFSDVDQDMANRQQFIDAFHIPASLEQMSEEEILKYYRHKNGQPVAKGLEN